MFFNETLVAKWVGKILLVQWFSVTAEKFFSKYIPVIHSQQNHKMYTGFLNLVHQSPFIAELVHQTQKGFLQRELHPRDSLQTLVLELNCTFSPWLWQKQLECSRESAYWMKAPHLHGYQMRREESERLGILFFLEVQHIFCCYYWFWLKFVLPSYGNLTEMPKLEAQPQWDPFIINGKK